MLNQYERNTLNMIFTSVRPEKITGIIEVLNELLRTQYIDIDSNPKGFHVEIAHVLSNAIKELKKIERRTSVNQL